MKNLFINLYLTYKSGNSFFSKIYTFFKLTEISLKKMINKKAGDVHINIKGFKVYSYGYGNLDFLYKEVFCMNEYNFNTQKKSPVIIDCGSNIGMASIYFKKLYSQCKILAFEANPDIFKILQKNISVNNLTNVTAHNIALYDKEDNLTFYTDENIGTGTGSIFTREGHNNTMFVSAKRLSTYLVDIEEIELIKMDVEGAEWNIINDLVESSSITKARQYIIEYHHNLSDNSLLFSDFLKKFELNNFGYNIIAKYTHLREFQNILIHFYKKEL